MVFHLYGELNAFPSLPLWFSRHFSQGISLSSKGRRSGLLYRKDPPPNIPFWWRHKPMGFCMEKTHPSSLVWKRPDDVTTCARDVWGGQRRRARAAGAGVRGESAAGGARGMARAWACAVRKIVSSNPGRGGKIFFSFFVFFKIKEMFFKFHWVTKKKRKKKSLYHHTFFSKPHAEISVEASRFLKMLGFFFYSTTWIIVFLKKLSLCVFFHDNTIK